MLTSTDDVFLRSGLELTNQLQAAGMNVFRELPFEPGKFEASTLRNIKRDGIRIVMLMCYELDAKAVASSAEEEGTMVTKGWAFLLLQVPIVISREMQGLLYMRPIFRSEGMDAFAEQVSHYTQSHFNHTISADEVDLTYSVALHDAILLYAHAATKVLSEGGDLQNGTAVTEAVRSVSFMGIGSQVALTKQGDRNESYEVMNIMVRADRGSGGYEAQTFVVHVHAGSNRGSNLFLEVLCAQVRAFLRVCVHACLHACMPV